MAIIQCLVLSQQLNKLLEWPEKTLQDLMYEHSSQLTSSLGNPDSPSGELTGCT